MSISHRNVAEAPCSPKGGTWYFQWPEPVLNVVFSQANGAEGTWQYPLVRSSVEMKWALPSLSTSLATLGKG